MSKFTLAAATIVGSIMSLSAAVAAPTITDRGYWPSAAISSSTTANAPRIAADGFNLPEAASPADWVYQGGPHPR